MPVALGAGMEVLKAFGLDRFFTSLIGGSESPGADELSAALRDVFRDSNMRDAFADAVARHTGNGDAEGNGSSD